MKTRLYLTDPAPLAITDSKMKIFYICIFILAICGCQSSKVTNPEFETAYNDMEKIQKELHIDQILLQEKAIFNGVEIFKREKLKNKLKSIYFVTSSGVHHGPARIYNDRAIISDTIYENGIMTYYLYAKLSNNTFCVSIRNGKPQDGNLFLPGHSSYGEIIFRNGQFIQVNEYDDKHNKKVLLDLSNQEVRNGEPWNGSFISNGKNVTSYANGKVMSTRNESELFDYIEDILEAIKTAKSIEE